MTAEQQRLVDAVVTLLLGLFGGGVLSQLAGTWLANRRGHATDATTERRDVWAVLRAENDDARARIDTLEKIVQRLLDSNTEQAIRMTEQATELRLVRDELTRVTAERNDLRARVVQLEHEVAVLRSDTTNTKGKTT